MGLVKIKSSGYFDKNKDDLLKLLPEFKELNQIKILDLCGKGGKLKKYYENLNKEVNIVEIERNKFNSGSELKAGNKFDVIYIGDVFSAFIDTIDLMNKINTLAVNGGTLMFSIPNILNYGVIYYLLMRKWNYSDEGIINKNNLRFYTIEQIKKILIDTGFQIDEIHANYSPHHGMVEKMSALVEDLGGDCSGFKKEVLVYQYLIKAKKVDSYVNCEQDLGLKDLHKEAYVYYTNKKYEEAIKSYFKILKNNENDENAIFGLGKCFESLHKFDLAFKCFSQMVKLYPSEKNIIEFAHYNVRQANHKEVISILEPFVKKYKDSIEVKSKARILKVIGNAYINLGDREKAKDYYLQARSIFMSIGEDRGVILVDLGTLEIQNNNLEQARIFYNQAISLGEELGRAYTGLGMIEISNSKNHNAINFFCKALEEDPVCMNAIFNLIQVAYKEKKNGIVVNYIKNYLKHIPDDLEMKYTLAGLYFELMDFKNAEIICKEIIKAKPDHENAKDLLKYLNKKGCSNIDFVNSKKSKLFAEASF